MDLELLDDVKLLNNIINDLNNCIKDQGEKLESIEDNLTKTDNVIETSNEELNKATEYKKEINKKYLTLAGVGGLLLYLLVL
jgi:t-SNARE complex subunit (syntaxin)